MGWTIILAMASGIIPDCHKDLGAITKVKYVHDSILSLFLFSLFHILLTVVIY